jgi:hypothetical protein
MLERVCAARWSQRCRGKQEWRERRARCFGPDRSRECGPNAKIDLFTSSTLCRHEEGRRNREKGIATMCRTMGFSDAIACDDEQVGEEWWCLGRRGVVFSEPAGPPFFAGFLLVAGNDGATTDQAKFRYVPSDLHVMIRPAKLRRFRNPATSLPIGRPDGDCKLHRWSRLNFAG